MITAEIRSGRATTTTTIKTPEKIAAQRRLAPEIMLTAVPLSDPPTGRPENNPAATLAAPWALKSREVLIGEPSGLGTVWLTPAPWMTAMIATEKAPVTSSTDRLLSEGSRGSGRLPLIAPISPTVATPSREKPNAMAVGKPTAIKLDTLPNHGVRRSPTARTSVSRASPREGRWMRWMFSTRSRVRVRRLPPVGVTPLIVGNWVRISNDGDAGDEPGHDR